MSNSASLELLAARADVWAFLAEPYHLPDWWPGITGIEPDRRGFAPGARWKAMAVSKSWFASPKPGETTLLVRDVDPYERWSWHLLSSGLDVEIRLQSVAEDRTRVTVTTSGGSRLARSAVKRLYDLVQTAATL